LLKAAVRAAPSSLTERFQSEYAMPVERIPE